MSSNQYEAGMLVRIAPEWCDSASEAEKVYVVVAPDEGMGRVDIAPRDWDFGRDGQIRPTQIVRTSMIKMIA